ncbi:TPA: NAD-dependent epimerase/dehydratase family protein [Candidatus Poribacteria bacterium]|nr:NAD-dependent epimerase/dehydratase family protein [Candidatus Poribacteria bacterium]
MKILITGVAGFIGSNLAEKLLEVKSQRLEAKENPPPTSNLQPPTYNIIGIDNLAYGVKKQVPEGVDFHQLDIRSKEIYPLFEGVDYVFHLAAKNCISDCQADPVETAEINVAGTVNVFEAARRAGVKKVIYAESSALYEGSEIFPTPESDVKPESFYAISKLASMYFAEAYSRFHNLRYTALRYFNVYGPRQDYRRTIPPVMSAFIIKLLRGEQPVIYGTGKKRRDFVHVDDVNDFHILCMNDPRTDGKVYNIGSGKNYSVLEVYDMISEILNIRILPIFAPDLPGEAHETLADITEAIKLGWSPKVDIVEGLKGMVLYIRKEMEEGKIQ